MTPTTVVRTVLDAYPKIFFACHRRHRRDPRTQKLLSESQARVLDHLDQVEPTSLTKLAEHLGVTLGTMSLSVERLVRRGYVRRREDPADGRKVRLLLTPAGARMKEAASVLDEDLVEAMMSRLDEADRALAVRGLELLADAAQLLISERASNRVAGVAGAAGVGDERSAS